MYRFHLHAICSRKNNQAPSHPIYFTTETECQHTVPPMRGSLILEFRTKNVYIESNIGMSIMFLYTLMYVTCVAESPIKHFAHFGFGQLYFQQRVFSSLNN